MFGADSKSRELLYGGDLSLSCLIESFFRGSDRLLLSDCASCDLSTDCAVMSPESRSGIAGSTGFLLIGVKACSFEEIPDLDFYELADR